MRRAEFANECHRLFNGTKRLDDLTDERVGALWERFGHLELDVWAAAITRCLCEAGHPTLSRLEATVEFALDVKRKRGNDVRDRQAKDFVRMPEGSVEKLREVGGDPDWAKLCGTITKALMSGAKIGPSEVLELLRKSRPRLARSVLPVCDAWMEELAEFGLDWPIESHRHLGYHLMRDGRMVRCRDHRNVPRGTSRLVATQPEETEGSTDATENPPSA